MKKYLTILFTFFLIHISIKAQVSYIKKDTFNIKKESILSGLRKAGFQDIDQSQPLMLDGITIPVYSEEFILLKGEDFNKVIMSADFIPEPYIDSNKMVKLFLFRKATDLEKSQMIQFSDDVNINKEIIGKPAINFIESDLLGNTYSLDQLKGKLIVINFWFVECKPCVMEIPDLNQLVEKYKNKDVVFLGIALSNKDKIQSFLKSKPFKYNIIPDAQDIASKYNILSYPTHMIIDKNSIVIYTNSGLSPTTISDLDKIIGTQIK